MLNSLGHGAQVERLSDNRQDVRQAACNCLLELLQVRVCQITHMRAKQMASTLAW